MKNYLYPLVISLCFCAFNVEAITYSAPIVITAGGTYTGNWESDDVNTPAIDIQTTQPVIIQNSIIRSKSVCIHIAMAGANVTIKNNCAYGLNPGVVGGHAGRFINSSASNNLVIENNYIESTAGIYILSFQGNGSSSQTIGIKYNQFKNIEGRTSTGTGYRSDDVGFIRVQAIQFDKVQNMSNVEVAWNEVVNEPYKSRSEDVINMYLSSGKPTSHILIHDNFINGSYPADVAKGSFSGGGIIADGNPTTLASATAYLEVYNNQIVATTNYGIAIACGHDNIMYNNRVVASGYLADNVTFLSAQNIGDYVYNIHSNAFFFNNNSYNNAIAWNKKNTAGAIVRNDKYFPNCITGGCTSNTSLTSTLTYNTQLQEYTLWQNKLSTNNITLGHASCIVSGLPTATITSPSTHFCAGGSLLLTANAGTGLTYEWSNASGLIIGATASTYSVTIAGSYTVNVTDLNNFNATSQALVVTVDALPLATITSSSSNFCTGGSVLLTSSTGTSYKWFNGTTQVGTAASYSATTAGSYTVHVTNAAGCSATSAVKLISVDALPTATITSSSSSFCTGASVLLTSSTGTSYKWFNGTAQVGTASSYSATTAGSYTVQVTNAAGCSATSAVQLISVNALPTATITSSSSSFCTGGSVLLTSSTGTSYKWFNGTAQVGTAASCSATTAGSYTVQVTNAAGCSATSAVKLISVDALPTASITSSSSSFCTGGSVLLTSSTGTSYKWFNGTIQVGTASSYSATTAGSYTVQVTNAAGCSATSVVKLISVDALPTASITSSSSSFCTGGSLLLTANIVTGYTYQWSNATGLIAGATNSSYSVSTAGVYNVNVSNGNCNATSSFITVQVDALPTISIAGSDQYISGTAVTLSANVPTSGAGAWLVASGIATIVNPTLATTNVTSITNATTVLRWTITNGTCASSTSTLTIHKGTAPVQQVIQGPNSVTPNQSLVVYSVPSNNGSTYQWTLPVGAVITSSNADNTSITVSFGNAAGDVSVIETSNFGTATSTLTVAITMTTSIVIGASNTEHSVKPNPFAGSAALLVRSNATQQMLVSVIDLNGNVCYSTDNCYTNTEMNIGSDLVAGMYVVQILVGTEQIFIKVIKL
jgi:hypothetical protein